MHDPLLRSFKYAWDFYLKRFGIIIAFSIPCLLALLIIGLVRAPTFEALGGVFLRIGSLPDTTILDIILITVAYMFSFFIIADTIVNINIVIRSKRTLTSITHEVLTAIGTYGTRIFYIGTMQLLLMFIFSLLVYENQLYSWLYPLFSLVLAFFLCFIPPAIVIDNSDTPSAIKRSISMAWRNPVFVIAWGFVLFVVLSITTVLSDLLFSGQFSDYFSILINSLFILPYFTILQTQMYMEKYPLAR